MIEAVFISDLHLHPNNSDITQRFNIFINWAIENVKNVYILGDLFHAWAGDDAIDPWSESIAAQLKRLNTHKIGLYYMHGNRDFLLGKGFAELAGMTILPEPSIVTFGEEKVMLVHGDRYCTKDRSHQWLRRLTRNRIFPGLFLQLPLKFRLKLVHAVREHSQGAGKPMTILDVVPNVLIKHMQECNVSVLIHGHTHKPGLTVHKHLNSSFRQIVLSDWDDTPLIMCYDGPNSFKFRPLLGVNHA